jgi:hypothetical protein
MAGQRMYRHTLVLEESLNGQLILERKGEELTLTRSRSSRLVRELKPALTTAVSVPLSSRYEETYGKEAWNHRRIAWRAILISLGSFT